VTLSGLFSNAVDNSDLAALQSEYPDEVTQGMNEHDLLDYHLRHSLADTSDDDTQAALSEIEGEVDNPDARLEWKTYNDTDLLNGFILFTRLYPESLSLESYDTAVNLISHYGTQLDDEFFNAFGSFIKEAQSDSEEQPTGSGSDELDPSGRSFA
jgi:hypothetical protein